MTKEKYLDPADAADLFPVRLREARTAKRLDQSELGRRTEMPGTSISLFELGKRKPSFESLRRLAVELETSADYLLGLTDALETPTPRSRTSEAANGVEDRLERIEGILSRLIPVQVADGLDVRLDQQRTG